MALSRSEIFLTFTIAVLTVFSICLGKCYLSEKNEKLRQINLNAQLNIEKENLQFAKNNIESENQRLQERNAELGGDKLVRLQEINNRIEELQNQVRHQLNRDIQAEALLGNIDGEDRRVQREQDLEFERIAETARLNTEIKNLHDEFLRIRLPQIRAEVQVAAYNRHNEIMQTYLNEIITAEGNLNRMSKIDVANLRRQANERNEDLEETLNGINDRITQELASREVHG